MFVDYKITYCSVVRYFMTPFAPWISEVLAVFQEKFTSPSFLICLSNSSRFFCDLICLGFRLVFAIFFYFL